MAEHSLGKGEVAGPIPAMGTIFYLAWRRFALAGFRELDILTSCERRHAAHVAQW